LETEAKVYVQQKILDGDYELAWSYVMDYEISLNPFLERKNRIALWKERSKIFCVENEMILDEAEHLREIGVKFFDSLHVACAVFMECDYFLTTDDRLHGKPVTSIRVIDPIEFIRGRQAP
jgi:predicted nucleic acid-binding protein